MTQRKFPCKYLSEKLSARRCYQCKEYICITCQKKHIHHIFCSYFCLTKYIVFEKLLSEKRYRDYAVLILIMTFIQVMISLIMYPGSEDSDPSRFNNSPLDSLQIEARSLQFSADTSFTNTRQSIKITGKAPVNTLLGLWNNGLYQATAVAGKDGYEFPLRSLSLGDNVFVIWGLSENGTSMLIDSISIDYSSKRISALAVPFSRAQTDQKVISLTFDGGSLANGADSIVTILSEKNIQTTFFLTGAFIENYPRIVRMMLEEQHELANHSYSHPHLTSFEADNGHHTLTHVDRQFIQAQLQKTDSVFYGEYSHHLKPYWRAPFGEYNREILLWAAEAGYKHVGWSRGGDTRDWISDTESPLYRSTGEIYNNLVELESRGQLRGSIILMHLHSDRSNDMPYKILPKIIDYLRGKGYRFVTISNLIHYTIHHLFLRFLHHPIIFIT